MESTVVGGALFLDGEWESICRLFTTDQDTDFASSSFVPHHHHHQDDYNNGGGSLPLLTSHYNVTNEPSKFKSDNVLEAVGNHLTPPSSNHLSLVSSISADTTTPFDLGCHFQTDQFSCLQPFMDFLSNETNKDDDDGGLFFTIPPDCDSISTMTEHLGTPMVDAGSSSHRLMMHNADELELVKPQQVTPAPKKRDRVSKDGEKRKRKISAKKSKESIVTTTEEDEQGKTDSNNNGQSSSCTDMVISHNESNAASLEDNDGTETSVTLNGKKIRANRGAATDPQSLYARKRRERINERLRILQNLVPNGTKVDISTMLEEAVHYVKFLQLQIKLLSSDDMWMYSPLAYHGYDINLCSSFSPYMMKS